MEIGRKYTYKFSARNCSHVNGYTHCDDVKLFTSIIINLQLLLASPHRLKYLKKRGHYNSLLFVLVIHST